MEPEGPTRQRHAVASLRPPGTADLMRPAFEFDVLGWPRCGGRLHLVAIIEGPRVIDAIPRRARWAHCGRAVQISPPIVKNE
jgi:hypothetical protein